MDKIRAVSHSCSMSNIEFRHYGPPPLPPPIRGRRPRPQQPRNNDEKYPRFNSRFSLKDYHLGLPPLEPSVVRIPVVNCLPTSKTMSSIPKFPPMATTKDLPQSEKGLLSIPKKPVAMTFTINLNPSTTSLPKVTKKKSDYKMDRCGKSPLRLRIDGADTDPWKGIIEFNSGKMKGRSAPATTSSLTRLPSQQIKHMTQKEKNITKIGTEIKDGDKKKVSKKGISLDTTKPKKKIKKIIKKKSKEDNSVKGNFNLNPHGRTGKNIVPFK